MTKIYKVYLSHLIRLIIIFLIILSWPQNSVAADDNPTVFFLPFNVLAAGEYSYLQDAAGNMLAGRIAAKVTIAPANRSKGLDRLGVAWKTGEEGAFNRSLQNVRTDYIIAGTIVDRDDLPRFDVYVFHVPTGKSRKFTMKPQEPDGIIGALDELAWEIAEKVFGGQRPSSQISSRASQESPIARFQTPHPDRLFKNAIISGLYGTDKIFSGSGFRAVPSWSSKRLDLELKSLAVGDIDGDGEDEMVLAADSKLILYKYKNNGFKIVATLKLVRGLKVYILYLADLDHNGRDEIYLNSSRDDRPSSYVIEWTQKGNFSYLQKDFASYLRPINLPGKGMILIGQGAAVDEPLSSSVYRLKSSGPDMFAQEQKLVLPPGADLFNFAYADIDNDGFTETVVIGQNNKMYLFNRAGELLWQSGEEYGAGKSYLGLPLIKTDDSVDRQLTYIPSRIIVADVNNDGKDDLIVGKNKMSKLNFFKNLRFFESGSIAALSWNGAAMVEIWRTIASSSYVADYQLRDTGHAPGNPPASIKNDHAGEGARGEHTFWLYLGRHVEGSLLGFFGAASKISVYQVNH